MKKIGKAKAREMVDKLKQHLAEHGGKRPGAGRPPSENPKDHTIAIRMDAALWSELRDVVDEEGGTVSDFVTEAVLMRLLARGKKN